LGTLLKVPLEKPFICCMGETPDMRGVVARRTGFRDPRAKLNRLEDASGRLAAALR